MHRSRIVTLAALAVGAISIGLWLAAAKTPAASAQPPRRQVVLTAVSGATIAFRTQNGRTVSGEPAASHELPYLVLHRNGALTPAPERTLEVAISGIEVPSGGVQVALILETQHGDPDQGGALEHRMPVWQGTAEIASTSAVTRTDGAAHLAIELADTVPVGEAQVPTPTDYYRYRLAVTDGAGRVLMALERDYVLLVESQVVHPLQAAADGAGPSELVIHYLDMVPYQNRTASGTTQLARAEVADTVATLVEIVVDAVHTQTVDWGFAWHPAWLPYRKDQDSHKLTVALTDGLTWYHGQAPMGGHSGLSLNVSEHQGSARYDTLIDKLASYVHHELFHNLQRSLDLHYGGTGNVDGKDDAWQVFSEGTAVLAASVGAQDAEFQGRGNYMVNAKRYIGGGGLMGSLHTSYAEMDPYAAAVYWRFLYEQCGGMDVIRHSLDVLHGGGIVNVHESTDIVAHLPAVVDEALRRTGCRFEAHKESLVAFATALHGLTEDNADAAGDLALHDPGRLYAAPTVTQMAYDGSSLTRADGRSDRTMGIPSSFGLDLYEIAVDDGVASRVLSVAVNEAADGSARIGVRVLRTIEVGNEAQTSVCGQTDQGGTFSCEAPTEGAAGGTRLVVVVVRIDAEEQADAKGLYTLSITSH